MSLICHGDMSSGYVIRICHSSHGLCHWYVIVICHQDTSSGYVIAVMVYVIDIPSLSRLLLLLEMLESMTCSLLHVFLLQLKKVIEQHDMHGIVANYIQVWSSWFFFASVLSNNLITRAVHFQGGSSADRRAMQGVMPKHLLLEPRQEERHFQRGLRPAITPTDVLFLPSAFFLTCRRSVWGYEDDVPCYKVFWWGPHGVGCIERGDHVWFACSGMRHLLTVIFRSGTCQASTTWASCSWMQIILIVILYKYTNSNGLDLLVLIYILLWIIPVIYKYL